MISVRNSGGTCQLRDFDKNCERRPRRATKQFWGQGGGFQPSLRVGADFTIAIFTGIGKSYEILGYTVSAECRRAALAEHFGEAVGAEQCRKMCDNCRSSVSLVRQDITYYVQEVLSVLNGKLVAFHYLSFMY